MVADTSPAFCRMTSRPGVLSLGALSGNDPRAADIRNLCRSMDRSPFRRQLKRDRIREAPTIGRVVASQLATGDLATKGDGVICKMQRQVLPTQFSRGGGGSLRTVHKRAHDSRVPGLKIQVNRDGECGAVGGDLGAALPPRDVGRILGHCCDSKKYREPDSFSFHSFLSPTPGGAEHLRVTCNETFVGYTCATRD